MSFYGRFMVEKGKYNVGEYRQQKENLSMF